MTVESSSDEDDIYANAVARLKGNISFNYDDSYAFKILNQLCILS